MTNHGGPQQPPQPGELGQVPYEPDAPTEQAAHVPTQVVPQEPPAPGTGRLIAGRYRLLAKLGHGGMGTVWRAQDETVDREVAVKEPRVPDHLTEREREKMFERMRREARAAARLDHPAVVNVHDVAVEDGQPWIVMEFVQGRSLGDVLREGTVSAVEAARIGAEVLGALEAAHAAGILHRDVKPDNVMLGRHDRVILTDFGIAQIEGETSLTDTGGFVGSPEFIAPERVLGQRPGPASDLWSLGVVLYAATEGVSPFRRTNTPATLQSVLSTEPQTPARAAGPLAGVIMQLLRKDPAARPDAAEVRRTLRSLAAPAPTMAYDPGLAPTVAGSQWVPPVLAGSRKRQYGFLGGLVAVAVALVLIFANPFGGGGLPEGWEVRVEREALQAEVAVPKDYKREVSTSHDGLINFRDPSAVFTVMVERYDTAEDTDALKPKGPEWADHYRKGGSNGTEIKDAKVTQEKATVDGREGWVTNVDYVPYSSTSDDTYRYRWQELLVPDGSKYWRIRVSMPAEGWARPKGEELYDDVLKGLKLY
ncbi:serine/threonine protein kinase [Streptomyces sp. A7024]|uniref:non-specific serine/threonine protein kinase n=1 Tax=Streptomyces coryli TaxID=1128680 RepID=A0A6G4TYA0_9ACTN|nr:serine/threonine-protein kinase [Streptomyces coryli]NGN64742.1 serine/threonine protein kinase [Streptomyces coryli]